MSGDITQYKIKDVYTGALVKASTVDELHAWLIGKQVTQTEEFHRQLNLLCDKLEAGSGYEWHAAALMLDIQPKKKTRRKRK